MLAVLQNNCICEDALPHTYAFLLYNHAILCPQGMRYIDRIGNLHLCVSCHHALTSTPPRQPKNSIVNFQYYGHEQLPEDVHMAL
ncbi:hypothetical protein PISMIDRAFT_112295 [Pisolithus microcarpus 441]|uniref:Uncharacterized protein n=1 Tax=Pisolithus microcarpus 441 TaxID=765257 RepID=A0A0C9XX01_9AGAM|nr:hypothetical protein BKA83DRAFT_112295 [Pisolithus microcarpus]KIK16985.1 hypothetical protein PISMIDRAFT_112295 [Pisolithus microcarpus 441]